MDKKSEKYLIVNKTTGLRLFAIDKNYNSIEISGSLKEMTDYLKSNVDLRDTAVIISEKDYWSWVKKIHHNKDWQEKKDRLYAEIRDMFPQELNSQIEYEYEKRDRNINGFPSITKCDADVDMRASMWEQLEDYQDDLVNKLAFNDDSDLLNEVRDNVRHIKAAWKLYQKGNVEKATEQVEKILQKYVDDPFFVAPLEKCYALKQIAYYDEWHRAGVDYSSMQQHPITLYRGRVSEKRLYGRKEMLHRPYVKNEKISRQRFTCEGMPALYLATTSYACWLELNKPDKDFYVSAFIPDENANNLKILNMAVIQELINGSYHEMTDGDYSRRKELQNKMLAFMPLVQATSYKYVETKKDGEEYIIPELVMRSLKKLGIDGVAYLSKHLEYDLQMQIGINVVIPVYKEHLDNGYGKVSKYFKMTKPELFSQKLKDRYEKYKTGSYISDIYYRQGQCYRPTTSQADGAERYGDTVFAKFDNYLVNMETSYYDEE